MHVFSLAVYEAHFERLLIFADGIVFGVSSAEQLVPNLDACEEGPLSESKSTSYSVSICKIHC